MERTREAVRPATDGSRTITASEAGPSTPSQEPTVGVLRLRGRTGNGRRVVWDAATVDNEGMGKKKSKICCIYHKPKEFDESSDESSGSDSGSASDSDASSRLSSPSSSQSDSDDGADPRIAAARNLRHKEAMEARKAKARGAAEGAAGQHDEEHCRHGQGHHHTHRSSSARGSRRSNKVRRSGATVTIVEPVAEQPEVEDKSGGSGHPPSRPKENAYERGVR